MNTLYKELLLMYIDSYYISKTEIQNINPVGRKYYIPIQNMYLGFDVLNHIRKLSEIKRNHFLFQAQNVLITSCLYKEKRFDFSDPFWRKQIFWNQIAIQVL